VTSPMKRPRSVTIAIRSRAKDRQQVCNGGRGVECLQVVDRPAAVVSANHEICHRATPRTLNEALLQQPEIIEHLRKILVAAIAMKVATRFGRVCSRQHRRAAATSVPDDEPAHEIEVCDKRAQ
jgi:hypothetical protein